MLGRMQAYIGYLPPIRRYKFRDAKCALGAGMYTRKGFVMRRRFEGIRKRIYRFTYDKPGLNKKSLQLRRSLDEVKKLLGGSHKNKK